MDRYSEFAKRHFLIDKRSLEITYGGDRLKMNQLQTSFFKVQIYDDGDAPRGDVPRDDLNSQLAYNLRTKPTMMMLGFALVRTTNYLKL